ncbi:hypothetical protein [Rhodovibrio sodomensis]|uniref:hypothetical protein n=1 Tax=Rhodovibrio sodomensis TaxID=1088 RepID=UPI001A914580|nr:hypothetical protein [Rhodovibrio sodomensis]
MAMPEGMRAPANGLTCFYGARNPSFMLAWKGARAQERSISRCELHVDVGKYDPSRISLDDLPERKFVDMERLKEDAREKVREYLLGYCRELGLEEDHADPWSGTRFRMRYPRLLGRLVQEPEFRHVAVLVYSVASSDGDVRGFGTLFDPAAVSEIQAHDASIAFRLPEIDWARPLKGPRVEARA